MEEIWPNCLEEPSGILDAIAVLEMVPYVADCLRNHLDKAKELLIYSTPFPHKKLLCDKSADEDLKQAFLETKSMSEVHGVRDDIFITLHKVQNPTLMVAAAI